MPLLAKEIKIIRPKWLLPSPVVDAVARIFSGGKSDPVGAAGQSPFDKSHQPWRNGAIDPVRTVASF